jgi:hypothetical protein
VGTVHEHARTGVREAGHRHPGLLLRAGFRVRGTSATRIKFEDKATAAGSWSYRWFDTSEQCYHFQKFDHLAGRGVQALIMLAESAHDAFKIAEEHRFTCAARTGTRSRST